MAKKNQTKKILPDISVIVAMYNAGNFIEECLQSLLNQTLKNIEVIVVDDCSTDNSVSVVKKFSDERLTLTSRHTSKYGVEYCAGQVHYLC